jgi:LuxR family maltose regulon positive regulatory protein
MPKAAVYAVIWSPERDRYELHHQGDRSHHPLHTEDGSGFIELVDGSSFAFQGKHGRLTLRKESRLHGEGYWYAYRNQGRRTRKKYVGRTTDLTIARLEDIAEAVMAEPRVSTDEHSQVKGGTIPKLQAGVPAEERSAALQRRVPDTVTTSPSERHTPVLAPKLHLPRLHASLLTRPRLLTRLDTGLQGKLTLLSAPAGFGKTTVVSQWVADHRKRQHHPPVAWISLDPGDNDPVRFWRYVITACQAFQPGIGQSALALLHTVARSSLELMLRTFLNELASLSHRGILVLEDYHVITSPQIHETLTFLLDHLPAVFHLILITRVDPPLPLARLRARGDLCELHAEDLRFSQEEMAIFLRQALPDALSPEEIRHLDTRLEGWVTGLRLVTLMLQRRLTQREIEHFLATFSGSHRHILEFFVTEVLNAQPEPLQVFLLQTSVLSRLSGSLCDAVTGRNNGEQFLKAVEDANLFLQSLDGSGQWYRYHPLFAEAMQQEARQRFGEDALHAWYSRASVWYEQQSMLTEAVEMALQAREFARAAALIEQNMRPHYAYHEMNEYHTLQRWLGSLPEDVLGQHPRLCSRAALLLVFSWEGRTDSRPSTLAQIERLLHRAECAWQAEGNRNGLGEILTFRAFLNWEQGDFALAARFAREALALLPESESQWRGSCFRIIGEEEMLAGRVHEARQLFQEALALFESAGNSYGAHAALLALAEVCWLQGALRQAAELYRAVSSTTRGDIPNAGKAQLGLARLSYEWNVLETAEQEAQEALDLGTRLQDEALQVQASLVLATIEQAREQTAPAQQRLHALLARLPGGSTHHLPLLDRHILAGQARLSLAARDLAAVERWSTTSAMNRESIPRLHQEQEDLITLRLLMAQGEAEEAIPLLEGWRVEAHQHGRTRSEVEILALMALAYFAQQRPLQGSSLLREALALAQAEGYQRLFLDEGEEMAALLRVVLPTIRKDPSETYVHTLLHAFTQQQYGQEAPFASSSPVSARLIEPLSPQEQRVLRLLVAGLSNPEIAEALVVSINTVKTQVRSIYRKLNVKSRKEARSAVRGQNLL